MNETLYIVTKDLAGALRVLKFTSPASFSVMGRIVAVANTRDEAVAIATKRQSQ